MAQQWEGQGRGVARLPSLSGIKLLSVFTFRTNTFLWWPGSLSIFETFVSKPLYFWVAVRAAGGWPCCMVLEAFLAAVYESEYV